MKKVLYMLLPLLLMSAAQSDEALVRKELDAIAASMTAKKSYSCVITTRMVEKPGATPIHTETVSLKKKDAWYNSTSPKLISIRNSAYQVSVLHETKTILVQKALASKGSLKKGLEEDMKAFFLNVSTCSVKKLDEQNSLITLNYKDGQFKRLEIKYSTIGKIIGRLRFYPNPEAFDDAGNGPIGGKPFDHMDIDYTGFDFTTKLTEQDFSVNEYVRIENNKCKLTEKYSTYKLIVQ